MKATFLLLILPLSLYAQQNENTIDLDALTERIANFDDNETEYEENLENLALLLSHPINLNIATAEELRFLKILSEEQITNLLNHREINGHLISTLELQAIPTFDILTIDRLLPYVSVTDPLTTINKNLLARIKDQADTYLLLRYDQTLETKKGFSKSADESKKFQGDPGKMYMRFRSSRPGDFSFGFTMEKDPGEKLDWKPAQHYYGFDHTSFHAQLQHKGRIKNIIVGDYQAQFGQGLVWGGIFGMGKGSETITSVRGNSIGFVPYTSAYEAGYLRGIATTLELNKKFSISGSWSLAKRDGALQAGESGGSISSILMTGLHRNDTELEKRKSFTEQVTGAAFQFHHKAIDAGLVFQQVMLSKPLEPEIRPYNQFTFRGRDNTNTGFYISYTYQNIAFFGEAAQTFNHGYGYIAGTLIALSSKIDLAVVHRRFEKDLYTFYSNGFSESTKPQNERGTYWGWKYRFNKKWSHSGYIDIFRFPGIKYRTYAPSTGYEWLLRFNWQPSRHVALFIQAREEHKEKNNTASPSKTYLVSPATKNNYWLNVDYGAGQNLRMKTRMQLSTYAFGGRKSNGFVLAQDISGQYKNFRLTARYAIFDTEDYDNRQYIYEQDVWLAYSLPAYDGVGVRKYLVLQYKMNKKITFWIRYSHTRYTDRNVIGSGMEEISGNTKNDLKFQLRIKF